MSKILPDNTEQYKPNNEFINKSISNEIIKSISESNKQRTNEWMNESIDEYRKESEMSPQMYQSVNPRIQ